MVTNTHASLLDAIHLIDAQKNKDAVVSTFVDYVRIEGFEHVAFGQLRNPATTSVSKLKGFIASNWPREWSAQWVDEALIMHDPIAQMALKTKRTFAWRDALTHANKYGRKVLERSREFGFKDGIAVPIHTGDNLPGCVSLAGGPVNISENTLASIELLSLHAYMRLEKILGAEIPFTSVRITPRETDVLHYVAAGKTNWEIGKILSISPNSVRDHIKSAARKLNCTNRAHTVAMAIQNSLILP